MSTYRTAPDPNETRMPGGIPFIVGNEAAERFSFYGMKAILAVFLTKHLVGLDGGPDNLSPEETKEAISWFVASAYATPFIGALIADRWWGKYHTILWLSLFYCAGHALMAMVDTPLAEMVRSRYILFAGLALIACGSGAIKPCVTAHVGDQFGPSNKRLLTRVYSWFYFSINIGAVCSQLLTPWLLNDPRFGPAWAFGVPGVLMAVATFMFWLGRHQFVHVPPAGKAFWSETFGADGVRALANLTPLLLFVAMFWSLFDQTASAWVLQADKMDLRVPLLGITMDPSQMQSINGMFVLTLVPLFSLVVYPVVDCFIRVTPLRKIGAGLFIAAGAFAVSALIEGRIDGGETPSIVWQVIAYLFLTAAEVLISITMLEFFYTQAPRRLKSIVMAFCMLSISLGNVFTALVNRFIVREDGTLMLEGASYYWFFVGSMLVVACGYLLWAPFYRGQTYLQGEDEIVADAHG
ncbi:Dipeptide and tripeptide permease A [Botrimarina colliarenosi]|uniref:Dipeptide and tripeptide permease A n=1 Tax=Botrimarina colliarenosi TaxID=2528001 RepID=A0A5C6A731_9BACT|nr:POT family MFS transporter [Botrimarina colliarenosi]TWT95200.1 Dipeptide and tripeptide permease A [Botrimarina colliarenosi]